MADARSPLIVAFLLALLALAAPARAQLEGALMPGKVIAGHAKLEDTCANCHVRFDKRAQDRLCLDCHKPVAEDVARREGMHGRIKIESCRACHTDHKGRDMNIAAFDRNKFDHAATDFALRGAHVTVKCESCHTAGRKFREAPQECIACHRKDDKHKGSLGTACASCHGEANWKDVRFDHDKTHFKLLDKHARVACAACHKTPDFKGAPLTCVGCHRKEDTHKGRFGEKCETCHTAADWKVSRFNHDTATRFALRFKHRTARCEACHTGFIYREKLETACISCHKKDDKHKGTLGPLCGDCHGEQSWGRAKFDHSRTQFPLTGKHADTECKACHKDNASFKDTPRACLACHRKDDTHKGHFGEKCESCHNDTSWKRILFNHERDTSYPLRGAHRKTGCEKCHTGVLYRDKTPSTCIGCHRKDDKHAGQLGERCESCHNEDDWKKIVRFDHNQTKFPLTGRHALVECKSCHATPQFKDAKSDCLSCHAKADVHRRSLGAKCETCHNARDWKAWDFDHGRKTRYPLTGAHAKVRCESCHRTPVKDEHDLRLPVTCASCHEKDDVHEGRFGRQCERCHVTDAFNRIAPGMGRSGVRQ
jgi:hypothetical protein